MSADWSIQDIAVGTTIGYICGTVVNILGASIGNKLFGNSLNARVIGCMIGGQLFIHAFDNSDMSTIIKIVVLATTSLTIAGPVFRENSTRNEEIKTNTDLAGNAAITGWLVGGLGMWAVSPSFGLLAAGLTAYVIMKRYLQKLDASSQNN